MRRRSLYEVPSAAYLFCRVVSEGTALPKPEEPVRQWCAFELLRAYGFSITDLVFEHPVKVGSKKYSIDILVMRGGTPWIVVECKEPDYARHEKGIEQAISYADASRIQAEFAVYTNGTQWLVRRKIQGTWTGIIDLPALTAPDPAIPLSAILSTMYTVGPLLHKLDEPLSGAEARRYLEAMQRFFHGHNLLTEQTEDEICYATDNLLRVLSAGGEEAKYCLGKLQTSRGYWERFRARTGAGRFIPEVDEGDLLRIAWGRLHNALSDLISGAAKPLGANLLLLRLDLSLLDYGKAASETRTQFPPITPGIYHAFRDYLNHTLTVRFNTQLPDSIDRGAIHDLKLYCQKGE